MRKNPDVAVEHPQRAESAPHARRSASLASRGSPSPRDALSAEPPALHAPPDSSHPHSASVDQLKFRIVARRRKHYFQDVRFKGALTRDAIVIIKFLEGRCLETLSARVLQRHLGHSPIVPQLENLLKDLRQVLCDE